jgi:hypothetical protein
MLARGGVVWCRGEQVRAAAAAVSSPHHGRARASKETEGDGHERFVEPTRQAGSPPSDSILQSFPTFPLQDSFLKVFDEMLARSQNSNFQKFQIGLVIILDRDSKTIFVRSRGGVLLQGYFEFGVVLCFRFKLCTDFEWC